MSSMVVNSPVLDRRQAAEYLRISPTQLSNIIHGKIPNVPPLRHIFIGRTPKFKRAWLDEFLEAGAAEC